MARITKESLDRWYDYGILQSQRTIYLGQKSGGDDDDATDYRMAESAIKGLTLLEATNHDPIKIIMNNDGGSETDGYAVYDAIKSCKSHVTIVIYGSAQSMGSVILQAADTRVLAPNSTIMLHYGSMAINSHVLNVIKVSEEAARMQARMEDIFLERIQAKHPGFTREELQAAITFDEYLTASEAVELGLADEVLDEQQS